MIALHLFAARMSQRFHRPVMRMIAIDQCWYALTSLSSSSLSSLPQSSTNRHSIITYHKFIPLRPRMRLAFYIQHFHTNHKYGLQYGRYGNVNFTTCAKFFVFYCKLLMFAFMLFVYNPVAADNSWCYSQTINNNKLKLPLFEQKQYPLWILPLVAGIPQKRAAHGYVLLQQYRGTVMVKVIVIIISFLT